MELCRGEALFSSLQMQPVMCNKVLFDLLYQPIITYTAAFQILCQCSVTNHGVMPEMQVGYNTTSLLICQLVTFGYWIHAHNLTLHTEPNRNPNVAIKNIQTIQLKKNQKHNIPNILWPCTCFWTLIYMFHIYLHHPLPFRSSELQR